MDFTPRKYNLLLKALISQGFLFQTFEQFCIAPLDKVIILRFDVEKKYFNALKIAEMLFELGISGTFYFRLLPTSFNSTIVKKIFQLNHEIGYHYDDLAECKGNYFQAIKRFELNIKFLRKIAPVTTVCMDGSPLSKYNNQHIWKQYKYSDYGIIGEPYFDIDFSKVLYLTDTGRRWDGYNVSKRDKVEQTELQQQYSFHSTQDIINAIDTLPNQIMITIHPQRWNDKLLPWLKEFILQNVKNVVKRFIV